MNLNLWLKVTKEGKGTSYKFFARKGYKPSFEKKVKKVRIKIINKYSFFQNELTIIIDSTNTTTNNSKNIRSSWLFNN